MSDYPAIRSGIAKLRATGHADAEIVAQIANNPTSAELAEMKRSTAGTGAAKAMVNLIQSLVDESNAGQA